MNPTTSAQLPDGLREAHESFLKAYFTACATSQPPDWLDAAMLAKQFEQKVAQHFTPSVTLTPPAAPAVGDEARKAATPRTDANAFHVRNGIDEVVEADFARTLERELTASQAATAEKQAECERLKAQLAEGREQWRMSSVCREQGAEIEKLRAELAEAEGRATKYWEQLCDTPEALGKMSPEAAPHTVGWAKELKAENDRLKQELAALAGDKTTLKETLNAIRAVNVDEFGQTGDEAINRLIDSCSAMSEQGKEARS